MVVLSPAPRVENASGNVGWPSPLGCLRLNDPLVSVRAALAAVQWRRMMNNIPQPMPFLMRLCVTPNISLMKLLKVVKVFSMIYWLVLNWLTFVSLPLSFSTLDEFFTSTLGVSDSSVGIDMLLSLLFDNCWSSVCFSVLCSVFRTEWEALLW